MHNVQVEMPTRYPGVITLMEEYQWTYDQIMSTPSDLIDELLTRIGALHKWQGQKNKRDQAKAKAGKNKGTKR